VKAALKMKMTEPTMKWWLPYDKFDCICECHNAVTCCTRGHTRSPRHNTGCYCAVRVYHDTTSVWVLDKVGTAAHCDRCVVPAITTLQVFTSIATTCVQY